MITTDESRTGIRLGRGHQSDIILDDISVSRGHAEISYKKGEFVIKDLDSKFGTLVEMKKAMEIKDELRIQAGRSLYTFRFGPRIRTCNYI
jgi:pSer/pThr/pTyr-binding forkhead associated (FHA) protein